MIISKAIYLGGGKMWLLNCNDDMVTASTLTSAHSFVGNIINPVGGHKQMGVLIEYELPDNAVGGR